MHPIPEETLAAYLSRRLPPAGQEAVSEHLRACPECAATAVGFSAWREVLPWADTGEGEDEEASALDLARMRAAYTPPVRRSWRRPALAAAASLLGVAGVLLWGNRPGKSLPDRAPEGMAASGDLEVGSRPRLLSLSTGAEVLLGSGSCLSHPAGSAAPWVLSRGSCLACVQGGALRLAAGGLEVRVLEGEVFLKTPASRNSAGIWMAEADAADPAFPDVAVLSGSAELRLGGLTLSLKAGEGAVAEVSGVLSRQPLSPGEAALLRESLLGTGDLGNSRRSLLGDTHVGGAGWVLDGRVGVAEALLEPDAEPYQASVRFKSLERPSSLGFCFEVQGQSTLWVPSEPVLCDGNWHTLGVQVSSQWVRLTVDGMPSQGVPRAGFRTNPVMGVSGVGLAIWGGRVEVSGVGSALVSLK